MIVVIDASGAMEILMQKEKADFFYKALKEATFTIAPDLFISELTNALWKHNKAKLLAKNECIEYMQDGINYVDAFIDSRSMWQEAFAEGINNAHSVYDMFYMVAARRHNGTLITNDSVLAAICKKNKIQVC